MFLRFIHVVTTLAVCPFLLLSGILLYDYTSIYLPTYLFMDTWTAVWGHCPMCYAHPFSSPFSGRRMFSFLLGKYLGLGTSPVGQRLRFPTPNAGDPGSIPGQGNERKKKKEPACHDEDLTHGN